jgi:hypothetical protein
MKMFPLGYIPTILQRALAPYKNKHPGRPGDATAALIMEEFFLKNAT